MDLSVVVLFLYHLINADIVRTTIIVKDKFSLHLDYTLQVIILK